MIKELTRKTIFAPRRLINEMVRWILGVHSSEGTIRVANTATPGEERSLDVNVDMDAMKARSDEWAASRGLSDVQRVEAADVMRQHLDGVTLMWRNDLASVNADWLDARLQGLGTASGGGSDDGTATSSYTAVESGAETGTSTDLKTDAWTAADGGKGATVNVLTRVFTNGMNRWVYYRPFTISADGRVTAIGAEDAATQV